MGERNESKRSEPPFGDVIVVPVGRRMTPGVCGVLDAVSSLLSVRKDMREDSATYSWLRHLQESWDAYAAEQEKPKTFPVDETKKESDLGSLYMPREMIDKYWRHFTNRSGRMPFEHGVVEIRYHDEGESEIRLGAARDALVEAVGACEPLLKYLQANVAVCHLLNSLDAYRSALDAEQGGA